MIRLETLRAMPTLRFTANIQRHVACPDADVPGATVGAALDAYFQTHARARGYVLDDRGQLRQHMAVFLNGRHLRDRDLLETPVDPEAVIDVIQALSGG
jgi:molybdopterin converting factor small subunit